MSSPALTDILAIPGNKRIYDKLSQRLDDGTATAFVGAGASFPMYPLWTQFIQQFADEAVELGMAEENDRTYCLKNASSKPQDVATLIHSKLTDGYYRAFINKTFDRKIGEDGKPYTPVHAILIDLNFKAYITTNYDPGLMEAYHDRRPSSEGRPRYIVWDDEANVHRWLTGDLFQKRGTRPVLYAHGYFEANGNVVLDRESYRRAYRGTNYRKLFEQLLYQDSLVFVGFGFSDAVLDGIADEVLSETAGQAGVPPRHIAVVGYTEEDGSATAMRREFLNRYHAELLLYPIGKTPDGYPDHSALQTVLKSLLPDDSGNGDAGTGGGDAPVIPPTSSAREATVPTSAPPQEIAESSPLPLVNLPERNQYFTGRTEELEQLREALTTGGTAAVTQAISGLGGIGKTSLVVEYAHKYQKEYAAILFSRADNEDALNSGYIQIARALNLPFKDDANAVLVVEDVRRWLVRESGWLLILDNADFAGEYTEKILKRFLPDSGNGHILITSRSQAFSATLKVKTPLRLEVLPSEWAENFLIQRAQKEGQALGDDNRAAVRELAAELGFLPLALEQAAAYIATHTSFRHYLTRYRKLTLELLDKGEPEASAYPRTVRTTWEISFTALANEAEGAAAVEVLTLSAFFAPNDIPFELLYTEPTLIGPATADFLTQAGEDQEQRQALCDELLAAPWRRYSLLSRNEAKGTYSVHRMVQAVLRDRLPKEERDSTLICAIATLDNAFPEPEFGNWNRCERMLAHCRRADEWIREENIKTEAAARLLDRTGLYLYQRGQFQEAGPLHEAALGMRRAILPDEHPDVAMSANNMGQWYYSQGRYNDAEPLLQEAQEKHSRIWREGHTDSALSINNYAILIQTQGRYSEAEPLFNDALAIRRSALPEEHPSIATSLRTLASLYKAQGRYSEAEPLLKEALVIYRSALPEGHPDIATGLNNLASLYQAQGRYSEAEPLLNDALVILRSALPEGHPDIATGLNNLAMLYQAQCRYSEAEPLLNDALVIRRSALPKEHPDIATGLNNLAMLYQAQCRYSEAEPLLNDALQIAETVLGQEHPDTKTLAGNYERFLQTKDATNKALTGAIGGGASAPSSGLFDGAPRKPTTPLRQDRTKEPSAPPGQKGKKPKRGGRR